MNMMIHHLICSACVVWCADRASERGARLAAGGAARREQTLGARGERDAARVRGGRVALRQGAAHSRPQEAQGSS